MHNQYLANQADNGGHGHRPVLIDRLGQITGLDGAAACDATWCCSLHGPLGLEYLKSYLAAGSESGVFVNFPLDVTSQVISRGTAWSVTCRARPEYLQGRAQLDIELAPRGATPTVRNTLLVRVPASARSVRVTDAAGQAVNAPLGAGYVRIRQGRSSHLDFGRRWPTGIGRRPDATARGDAHLALHWLVCHPHV